MTPSVDFLISPGTSARGPVRRPRRTGDDPDALLRARGRRSRWRACWWTRRSSSTPEQVDDLFRIAVLDNVPVLAYGIRTDFRTRRLPRLPAAAGDRAHARGAQDHLPLRAQGHLQHPPRRRTTFVFDGDQVAIDGQDVWYESLCGACYLEASGGRLGA